ncbi:MAG: Uma2 family endonuclease [Kofleriaceae bacterium]
MAAPAKPSATYADIERLPPDITGQLIDGVLYTHSRPATPHAQAASVLGMDLGGAFHRGRGGPGGWILLDEPELHFGLDVVVPDLGGWRRERMPALPRAPFLTLAPDWVCEVLSPSTASIDRGPKLKVYGRERIPWVWLVDPIGRTLEVLALDGPTYRITDVYTGRGAVRAQPFDAIELDLDAVFPAEEIDPI